MVGPTEEQRDGQPNLARIEATRDFFKKKAVLVHAHHATSAHSCFVARREEHRENGPGCVCSRVKKVTHHLHCFVTVRSEQDEGRMWSQSSFHHKQTGSAITEIDALWFVDKLTMLPCA